MIAGAKSDLVIALDYYDGEAEGFGRCCGECGYFTRLRVGDDDTNEYEHVSIECSIFDEIVRLLGGTSISDKVFVYSGSDDGLNQYLNDLIPDLRLQLQRFGRRLRGRSYLEAAREDRGQKEKRSKGDGGN